MKIRQLNQSGNLTFNQKVIGVFQLLKQKLSWNGEYKLYSENLEKVLKAGTGSNADLNIIFISILIGIYVLYALISGTAEHGWASLMLSIWFVGGVVLLSIGAVGLYIGKIYKEVKRRPLYNVEEVLYDDQNK